VQNDAVGSVLSVGVGGVVVEQVVHDSLRFLPLTDLDADRLVTASRLGSLLPEGSAERAHLCDLLLRLSALADAVPDLAEVALNPVIVTPEGAAVTDARVRLVQVDHESLLVRRLDDDL